VIDIERRIQAIHIIDSETNDWASVLLMPGDRWSEALDGGSAPYRWQFHQDGAIPINLD
jgi:hypothetical protein